MLAPQTIYIMLTHYCPLRCRHCMVNSGPDSKPFVMNLIMLRKLLRDISRTPSVQRVVFTGGEPFVFYQHLRLAVQEAALLDLSPAVWTSGLFLQDPIACPSYIKGLVEMGLTTLILSGGPYMETTFPEERLSDLQTRLYPASLFLASLEPKPPYDVPDFSRIGVPWIDGPVSYMGRASKLVETEGQTLWDPASFDTCPHIDLTNPTALHVDPWGNVHMCPGIPIGNLRHQSFRRILSTFRVESHPIADPLKRGGPYELAVSHGIDISEDAYADACHMCYSIRKKLLHKHTLGIGPITFYV